ncbi:hypothetical protein YPS_0756 [Yersinia pestis Pestoides A]|nr:hypothetical protein YPS_0756 [Yersinia pestis Pestoides A]
MLDRWSSHLSLKRCLRQIPVGINIHRYLAM